MKLTRLLTLLAFATAYLCNAQVNTILNGKAIICGHSDVISNELQVITLDILGVRDIEGRTYIDFINSETGNFKFEVDISIKQDVYLEYNKRLTLLVSPGDSLFINFDSFFDKCEQSDIAQHVRYTGQNSEVNQSILDFLVFKEQKHFNPDCDGKTVEQYKFELSNWIERQKEKLNDFVMLKRPSQEFIDWAKFDIIYGNANYLIDYMAYIQMNQKPMVGDLFDTSIFPVDNQKALISRQYRFHLNQYFVFKYFKDSAVQKLFNQKDYYLAFKQALKSIMLNETIGVSKDILINDLFYRCLIEDYTACQKLRREFISYISDDYLRFEFEKQFNTVIAQPKYIEFISSSNSNDSLIGDVFKDIEFRHKGKVIYVDIWATYCGPCRSEFPYSHKLYDFYKNQNVEFVYICINSLKDNWENTLKIMKLHGNHYYLNKVQSEIFVNKFQISSFPTYYLINKNGFLIDQNAPRPSSNDIKDKIDKLLNE